jgi:flagellin
MAGDVTLSASVRDSLLSLQNTTDLISRTQGRLSKGLKVSGPIDDPVAFFQAKSLSDRASDFIEKKDAIDQGISTVTAALDGVTAIESLVKQMKGIANSMKSATSAQISDLVAQFNDLRNQINNLATDATYQGTNLINGTGTTLSIEFSEQSASLLDITSVDIRSGTAGLNVSIAAGVTGDDTLTHAAISVGTGGGNVFENRFLTTTADFSVTYQGTDTTFSAGETISFTYGTGSTFNFLVSTSNALTLTQGAAITVDIVASTTGMSTAANAVALLTTGNVNASFGYASQAVTLAATAATGDRITLTYNGTSTVTLTTADDELTFTLGSATVTLLYNHTGASLTLTQGGTFTLDIIAAATQLTAVTAAAGYYVVVTSAAYLGTSVVTTTGQAAVNGIRLADGALTAVTANGGELSFDGLVSAGNTTQINVVIAELDTALTTLRTNSQTLGANVALLNTRLNFTESYVNTLTAGADKLTLSDINEEGANLLALQTRQQLGIQALSLAAQAEASILQLFG